MSLKNDAISKDKKKPRKIKSACKRVRADSLSIASHHQGYPGQLQGS